MDITHDMEGLFNLSVVTATSVILRFNLFVFVNLENSFFGLSKICCKLSISWHNSQCTAASSFFPAE
jgi:hypothetical protein